MYELLYKKISEIVPLSEKEFEFCKTLFKPKKLRKRRFLLGEGEVCQFTAFVEKGLLQTFIIDKKGAEHTLQFSFESWWVSDLSSFLTGEPSHYNIEALEDSELLMISRPSWDLLLEKYPVFERYFRILIQNNLIVTQQRLMASFINTAEEKYRKLIHRSPDILQRIPQHMIASYLGISRETLSRIRAHMARKQPD